MYVVVVGVVVVVRVVVVVVAEVVYSVERKVSLIVEVVVVEVVAGTVVLPLVSVTVVLNVFGTKTWLVEVLDSVAVSTVTHDVLVLVTDVVPIYDVDIEVCVTLLVNDCVETNVVLVVVFVIVVYLTSTMKLVVVPKVDVESL